MNEKEQRNSNNESFHRLLTEGVKVSYQKDGNQRGDLVWLVDFANPENNNFVVANQLTVIENGVNKRPDVVLFVNGLPLVVIELKNAADENATIKSAFKQLQTYKQTIPSLFTYNGLMIISDGLEARAGSLSAGFSRFMSWKTANGKFRNRTNEILFIDARNMGHLINRRTRELSGEDIQTIAGTYHNWRNPEGVYEDVKGFCNATPIERVKELDYVLTPGRYVGLAEEEDDFDFAERFSRLKAEFEGQLEEEAELNQRILDNLAKVKLGAGDE